MNLNIDMREFVRGLRWDEIKELKRALNEEEILLKNAPKAPNTVRELAEYAKQHSVSILLANKTRQYQND